MIYNEHTFYKGKKRLAKVDVTYNESSSEVFIGIGTEALNMYGIQLRVDPDGRVFLATRPDSFKKIIVKQ